MWVFILQTLQTMNMKTFDFSLYVMYQHITAFFPVKTLVLVEKIIKFMVRKTIKHLFAQLL